MSDETALEKYVPEKEVALELSGQKGVTLFKPRETISNAEFQQMIVVAKAAGRAKLYGLRNEDDGVVCAMKGYELGLSVGAALENIKCIMGNPTMSARFVESLIKARFGPDACEVVNASETEATVIIRRPDNGKEYSYTSRLEKIPTIQKKKEIWQNYPMAMLIADATRNCAATSVEDVLGDFHTTEEMMVAEQIKAPAKAEQLFHKKEKQIEAPKEPVEIITPEQHRMLEAELGKRAVSRDKFHRVWGIAHVPELPAANMQSALDWLETQPLRKPDLDPECAAVIRDINALLPKINVIDDDDGKKWWDNVAQGHGKKSFKKMTLSELTTEKESIETFLREQEDDGHED